MEVFAFESTVSMVAFWALTAIKAWAFVDALTRRTDAFAAAGKLTKPAWTLITGLSLVAQVVFQSPLGLLALAGTIASFVYLLDVRPAVAGVTRR